MQLARFANEGISHRHTRRRRVRSRTLYRRIRAQEALSRRLAMLDKRACLFAGVTELDDLLHIRFAHLCLGKHEFAALRYLVRLLHAAKCFFVPGRLVHSLVALALRLLVGRLGARLHL